MPGRARRRFDPGQAAQGAEKFFEAFLTDDCGPFVFQLLHGGPLGLEEVPAATGEMDQNGAPAFFGAALDVAAILQQ